MSENIKKLMEEKRKNLKAEQERLKKEAEQEEQEEEDEEGEDPEEEENKSMAQKVVKSLKPEIERAVSKEFKQNVKLMNSKFVDIQKNINEMKDGIEEKSDTPIDPFFKALGISSKKLERIGAISKLTLLGEKYLTEKEKGIVDQVIEKATITSGSGDGGENLVGTETFRTILGVVQNVRSLASIVPKFTTTDKTYEVVLESDDGDAGHNYAEDVASAVDAITFTNKTFTLERWAKVIGIARLTLETAHTEEIGAFIVRKMAFYYGKFVSAEVWTDCKVANALNSYSLPATKTSFSDITLDDISKAKAQVSTQYWNELVMVVSPSVFLLLERLKDSQDRPLLDNASLLLSNQGAGTGGIVPNGILKGVLNIPVIVDETLPATSSSAISTQFILLVAPRVALGHFSNGSMAIETNSSVEFLKDNVLIRGQDYHETGVLVKNAGVVITTPAA